MLVKNRVAYSVKIALMFTAFTMALHGFVVFAAKMWSFIWFCLKRQMRSVITGAACHYL